MGTIGIAQETIGKAVEVFPGFWIAATRHHPGLSKQFPEINNRCLVFRLEENGKPLLFVVNAVDPLVIPEIQRLERETGFTVRYIVSPGGGHHLMFDPWVDAFPQARALLPPSRVPRTVHGKKLMEHERVGLYDATDPFPQFRGQLEAEVFDGLLGLPDTKSPAEGGSDNVISMVKDMFSMMFRMRDPVDELWLFHVPSGTVIGGENLGWMLPEATRKQSPFMLRQLTRANVWIQTMARKVADKDRVAAHWQRILAWPAQAVMTYHDAPGFAYFGDGQAALRSAATASHQLARA